MTHESKKLYSTNAVWWDRHDLRSASALVYLPLCLVALVPLGRFCRVRELTSLWFFWGCPQNCVLFALTALASRHDLRSASALFYLLRPSVHQCLLTSPTILFKIIYSLAILLERIKKVLVYPCQIFCSVSIASLGLWFCVIEDERFFGGKGM